MDLSPLSSAEYPTDRIPDGDVVKAPTPALAPPPQRLRLTIWLCMTVILAAWIVGIVR